MVILSHLMKVAYHLRCPKVTCLTSRCCSAGALCLPFTDRSDTLSVRHPPVGHWINFEMFVELQSGGKTYPTCLEKCIHQLKHPEEEVTYIAWDSQGWSCLSPVRNGGQAVYPRASWMSLNATESIPFVKPSPSRWLGCELNPALEI